MKVCMPELHLYVTSVNNMAAVIDGNYDIVGLNASLKSIK
jgi:hypothetical protein